MPKYNYNKIIGFALLLFALAALALSLAGCDPKPPLPDAVVCPQRVDGGVPVTEFPGANCTGVIPGTSLTASGDLWVDTDGVTISNLDVDGNICVRADDVTIQNTRVTNGVIAVGNPIFAGFCGAEGGAHRLTLIDVEIRPNTSDSVAIEGSNWRPGIVCLRCNIHRTGAAINGGNYTLGDTYIHDLLGETNCTKYPVDCISHNDGIQIGGSGGDVLVTHSNIEGTYAPESTGGGMSCTVCIYSHGDWGPVDNVLIQNSRIASADAVYCAYGADSNEQNPTNVRYVGNTFAIDPETGTCGHGGPITAWLNNDTNVWDNNHFDDGTLIPEPGG